MAIIKLDVDAKDLWVADTNARVISRQATQGDSFSFPVYAGSSYLLLAFDEDNGDDEWTAETFNQKLFEYFVEQNNGSANYIINRYQLIGLANTSRVTKFTNGITESTGSEATPDFYSTLAGSFRLSFTLKSGVTLPSLPQNILDLFEANQIQKKVARHFQQAYKSYSVSLIDAGYSTKYMALVIVNAVDKTTGDNVVIGEDYTLASYFEALSDSDNNENTDPLFTNVQNLGYLIYDNKKVKDLVYDMSKLEDYYDISLLGSNQMRMTVANREA